MIEIDLMHGEVWEDLALARQNMSCDKTAFRALYLGNLVTISDGTTAYRL